ncbi:MAG: ABC transporter permease [Chloroflexi bacterium]|nr:ABC transporter permease [Chloroflexota bacterium]
MAEARTTVPVLDATLRRSSWRPGWLPDLRRWPVTSVIILVPFAIAAVAAPLVAPYGLNEGSLSDRLLPPLFFGGTTDHILGTDPLGRDMLSRIIYGARITALVAGVALVAGGAFGTVMGLISGYLGGWVDEVIMRIVDIKFSLPFILIALALTLIYGSSLELLLALLAFLNWGGFARQVRGEVLLLREMDYVKLAKVAGASTPRILIKHIFPGVLNTVAVVATISVGGLILAEAGLSFLGAGIPPPTPAWGSMTASGRLYIATSWWASVMPGLAIALVVVALTLLGDWMRDRLDPRLRQVL